MMLTRIIRRVQDLVVPQSVDITIRLKSLGRRIPEKNTIMFLQLLQLDLYREIVNANGDEVILGGIWARDHPAQNLAVRIVPYPSGQMTLGCSILALQKINFFMMQFTWPHRGFFEGIWDVRRAAPGESPVLIGDLRVHLLHTSITIP